MHYGGFRKTSTDVGVCSQVLTLVLLNSLTLHQEVDIVTCLHWSHTDTGAESESGRRVCFTLCVGQIQQECRGMLYFLKCVVAFANNE